MPSIYLAQKVGTYKAQGDSYTVTEDTFKYSNYFKKILHLPNWLLKVENIEFHKGSGPSKHKFYLKPDQGYANSRVLSISVYFNKYDSEHKNPLLIVLDFTDNLPKYIQNFVFSNLMIKGQTHLISEMFDYHSDVYMLDLLISENDLINDNLTFSVDIKNEKNKESDYNVSRILISPKEYVNGKGGDNTHGFYRFRHKPRYIHGSKPSYFLYNKNLLLDKKKEPLQELQGNKYNVTVYWTDKTDLPLLLEFNIGGHTHSYNLNNVYYITRYYANHIYFERLDNDTYELNRLVVRPNNDMYTILTSYDNQILIGLLKLVQYSLLKTMVVVLDKKKEYSAYDLSSILRDYDTYRLINRYANTKVRCVTKDYGKCLQGTIFELYEHDFSNSTTSIKYGESVKLNFIVPEKVGTTYKDVTLHTNFTANVTNYLYYNKPSNPKVYVYFYGDDIRPLLFCYEKNAYRIHDVDYYFYKWYIIPEITNCTCNYQGKSQDSSDTKLIETLNSIVKKMGLVKPQLPIETKKEVKNHLSLDISKTRDYEAPSPFKNVKVSEQQKFDESDLFCYHSHNLSDYSLFSVATFIYTSHSEKTIKLDRPISNVRSIDVYMNTFIPNPLIVAINTDSDKTFFYKDLIKNDLSTYTIKQDSSIKKNVNLYEILLEENDKINNTSTFLIDKINRAGSSVSYGYDGRIIISQSIKNEFTLYTHTFRGYSKTGYLLFNKKVVKVLQEGELISKDSKALKLNTNEDLLGVYYLSNDLDCNYPLLIGSRQSNNVYSFYKLISTSNEYKWQKIKLNFNSHHFDFDSNIISLLDSTNYHNKSSIIIELDKKDVKETSYPMRIIDNKPGPTGQPLMSQYSQGINVQPSINISVSHPNIINDTDSRNHTDFRSVSHEITESRFTSINKRDICGLRLFILMSSSSDPVEAFLYDSKNSINENERVYLYYKPGTSENIKIYVYYNKDDLRPLLICYNQKTYKRLQKNDNTKWVFVQSVRCHESSIILNTLKSLHITVKKKITFLKDGSDQTNVKSSSKNISEFNKIIYEPNKEARVSSGPFKLSKNVLIKGVEHSTIIDKLFENLYSKPFENICAYYKIDPTKPLLFEFVDEFKKTHFQRRDADGYYWINEPFDYDKDDVLAKKLREIESAFNVSVIYEIDKTSIYNNVTVEHTNNVPEHGFTKYTHTNKSISTLKQSLVLINGLKLKRHKYGKVEIYDEIESRSYPHINVYFNSAYLDIPLIIELPKSQYDNQSDFYCHKKDINGNYWEKLTFEYSRKDKELTTKLKRTLFNITDSIVIFMDKRPGSGYTTYGFSEMQDAISKFIPPKHTIISSSYSNSIKVVNQTHIKGMCISEYGYKIFEHEIVPPTSSHSRCGIRFFIPNSIYSSSKYSEISFYTNINASDYNQEYIYCDRVDNNVLVICFDEDPRPLMLIYAGTAYRPKKESNPIPEKQVIVDYTQWILDDSFPSICEGYQAISKSKLLNSLFDVVCYLNPVQINPNKISNLSLFINAMKTHQSATDTYVIHKYSPDTDVEIKITATNLSCYRKYSYESNGTNKNSYGFRLGDVIYQGNRTSLKTFKIDYSNSYNRHQRLLSVESYYSLYDVNHHFPLLVVLEFVNSSTDFYELISKKDEVEMRWAKISDHIDSTTIETKLYEIKNRLEIQFDTSKDPQTLFNKDECHEDSNTDTIIKATSGTLGTLATVGTTVGVTAATHPEWFIPVIRALI